MYFVKNLVRIWLYFQFLGVSFYTFLLTRSFYFFQASCVRHAIHKGMPCRTWRYKPAPTVPGLTSLRAELVSLPGEITGECPGLFAVILSFCLALIALFLIHNVDG